jgi:ribosomal protein S12 methylthiotransferase
MGCPKNKVDSDGMEMLLRDATYRETDAPEDADVLIVNTCGFLVAAKEESIGVLQGLAAAKRDDQLLVAAGCLAQRNGAEVLERVSGIDGLLGTRRWMDVLDLLKDIRGGSDGRRFETYSLLGDPIRDFESAVPRPPVVGGSAYLKISDGCNAPCAFCTIPSFKGKLRSRPMEAIVNEAAALVTAGAKELVIVAQDTTDYGRDRGEANSLARLLASICNRTGDDLRWLRLMYAYPGHVSDELIDVMANEAKIVPYLDMPLQHGDPRTLRRMHRPSRLEMVYDHVEKLRSAMPDMTLRTTFIVGYPGETEEEFQGLLDFVEAIEFDKVGAFTFSPEPDTPAALQADPVADEIKEERYARLMSTQQPISLRKNQAQLGRVMDILIEGEGEIEGSGEPLLLGRSYRDAPEVDGLVLVPGLSGVPIGEMFQVLINGAMEYDLVGEPVINQVYRSTKESIGLGKTKK